MLFNIYTFFDYEHQRLNLKCFSRIDKTMPLMQPISAEPIYPDISVTSELIHA